MKGNTGILVGFALWGLVVVLVLLPRIPEAYGGNLWLWVAAYVPVVLLVRKIWRHAAPIREWWRSLPRARRWLAGAAVVAASLGGTLVMRLHAPGPFGKLSRENGLWEPLCLTIYWGGAALLYRMLRDADPATRRPWLLAVGFYFLMGLEEIDYFSIFGGIFGHVKGVYVGSLHDLIRLVAESVLSPAGLAIFAALLLVALAVLRRAGILEPALVARLARSREIAWLVAGLALLMVAAAEEAHLFGWIAAPPTPEEAVELGGALCLGVYALELAAERLPTAA